MDPSNPISNKARREDERKVWRTALLLSALVHVLVFALWPVHTVLLSPFAAAGPRSNDPRGAAGTMQALNIASAPAVRLVAPPVPLPTLVEIEPVRFDDRPVVQPSIDDGLGRGIEGPGLEEGAGGKGDGGTGDEGLFRVVPPTPRGMIIPPFNKKLKGSVVEVWVFVNELGHVVSDSTRLRPPTSDRDFNQRLIREAAEWVFAPAMQGGKPVATWFPYTFSM